jgi:hypothetical protein
MADTGDVKSRPRQLLRTLITARPRVAAALAAAALVVPVSAILAGPAAGGPVSGSFAATTPLRAGATAATASYGIGAPIPFRLFPADNAWNAPVDKLPLDPGSSTYIAHMSPGTGLHPDFGTKWEGADIGIPYVVVSGAQAKVPIHFVEYGGESDAGPYPVPGNAPVEGAGGGYADGDRHVLVLDADGQRLYELYHAVKQPDGSWNAGSGAIWDLTSNELRPAGWTSADAAGLPILPGLARYDEIVTEGVLDHALRFTVSETQRKYLYPATHWASSSTDSSLPPMGLRVRLKAGFDISGFPPEVQVILRGLKKYGMMVADNGSDWYVGGAPDTRWDDDALHSLGRVKGSDFEVVDSRALRPGAFFVALKSTAAVRHGRVWSRRGSVFDPTGSSWTATVNYGDGSARRSLTVTPSKTFSLAHRYRHARHRYTVSVTVRDDRGRTATAHVRVRVR